MNRFVARVLVNSIARLGDITGTMVQFSPLSTADATVADWEQVGEDLRAAMDDARRELPADSRRRLLDLVEAR